MSTISSSKIWVSPLGLRARAWIVLILTCSQAAKHLHPRPTSPERVMSRLGIGGQATVRYLNNGASYDVCAKSVLANGWKSSSLSRLRV